MLGLAALLLLFAPAPAAVLEDVDPVIARVAAGAQEMVGTTISGLMRITGMRGEGRALVLTIEMAEHAPALFGPQQVAAMTAMGMCSVAGMDNFFRDGRVLLVQVARTGRAEQSVTIDHCSGPAGEGLTAAVFAAGMQALVGVEDDEMTVTAVRAEGDMLIVTLAPRPGRPATVASIAASFARGFCRRPEVGSIFFGRGLILRADMATGGGDPVPGPVVSACPAQ